MTHNDLTIVYPQSKVLFSISLNQNLAFLFSGDRFLKGMISIHIELEVAPDKRIRVYDNEEV